MNTITLRPSLLHSSLGVFGGSIAPEMISGETLLPFGTLSSTHSTSEWCLSEISLGPQKDFYLLQFKQGIQTGGLSLYLSTLDKTLPLVVVDMSSSSLYEVDIDIIGFPEKVLVFPGHPRSRYSPVDGEFEISDPRLDPGLVF